MNKLLLFFIHLSLALCYRILINCDAATKSHVKGLLEVGDYLIQQGHTIIFANQEFGIGFSKGNNATQYILPEDERLMKELKEAQDNNADSNEFNENFTKKIPDIMASFHKLNYPNMIDLIQKEEPFDLFICDFMATACQDAARENGIPLIVGYQALDFAVDLMNGYKTGINAYGPLTIDGLNFFQRYYYKFIEPAQQLPLILRLKDKIGKSRKLYNINNDSIFGDLNYGLGLGNSFFGFEIPAKVPPNFHVVGPLSKVPNLPLDQEIQRFLNEHNKVIYVAFGSFVQLGPKTSLKLIQALLYALETKVLDGVIWGLGRTTINNLPKSVTIPNSANTYDTKKLFNNGYSNIKLLRWAPQHQILNHINTKLFISHGGLESITEACITETAILCMPIFGDQPKNAKKVEEMNIGVYLDYKKFQIEDVLEKIKIILDDNDGMFDMNLKRVKLITSNPDKKIKHAADIVLQHIEISKVCRSKKPYIPGVTKIPCELSHLISSANHLSFFVKHNLDIYLFNTVLLGYVLYAIYKTSTMLLNKVVLLFSMSKGYEKIKNE